MRPSTSSWLEAARGVSVDSVRPDFARPKDRGEASKGCDARTCRCPAGVLGDLSDWADVPTAGSRGTGEELAFRVGGESDTRFSCPWPDDVRGGVN